MADGAGIMLQSTFHVAEDETSEEVILTFDDGRISWETASSDRDASRSTKSGNTALQATTVALDDVILAEVDTIKSKGGNKESSSSFSIHYVVRVVCKKERHLVPSSVQLFGSADNCTEWTNAIQNAMDSMSPGRPKKVLAFVNPLSGKRQSAKIFDKSVRPLLEKYGVTHQVIETERSGHIEDLLMSMDLTDVDGVLTAGGDGTLTEAVNGLARRAAKDQEVDENNPEGPGLEPLTIPIGIIPTGTGNVIIDNMNNTKDVVTATLSIILGGVVDKDAASVHCAGKLVRYSILCSALGMFVDWLRKAEANRWMGIGRLLWGGVYCLAKHPVVEYEIDFLPSGRHLESEKSQQGEEAADTTDLPSGWCRRRGQFVEVNAYVFEPTGSFPVVRKAFGNGEITLILVRQCSRTQHTKYLAKFLRQDPDMYEFDYVESVKAEVARFRPIGAWKTNDNNHYLNIDGDIVHLSEPEFSIRIHQRFIRLFAVKIPKEGENAG